MKWNKDFHAINNEIEKFPFPFVANRNAKNYTTFSHYAPELKQA